MDNQAKAKPFSNMELSSFCGQIAMILKSGISSIEGLQIMCEDAQTEEEKQILTAILDQLMETGNLSQSLQSTGLFPDYLLHMARIGEETGNLDEVMASLSEHYDREDTIAKSIRNAVTYPLIMSGMMIVVILVLLIKVMPIFNQVFIQLGTEMTGFSRTLMRIGNTISNYSIVFAVLLILIVGLIFYLTRTASGKKTLHRLAYKFKFSRAFYEEIAACRFASGLALTLRSGLNPERGMELVQALNDDTLFQKKLEQCNQLVSEGADLSVALHKSGILTGMHARTASIGEKTGSMDQAMGHIASAYQENIDARMNHYLSILEPTLVITLSMIVGVILLSVMLPLMGIMSGI